MSSSDPVRFERVQPVTAWVLDEFEMAHIFEVQPEREVPPPEAAEAETAAARQLEFSHERARAEAAAYARGRADGERNARAELVPVVETATSALASALVAVQSHQARWTANAEENLAVLAVAVARHVIAHEVEIDPSIVTGLVQRALSQCPLDQPVTVRLHPADVDSCNELLQPAAGDRFHELRWIADQHVVRGGCIVEGRERIIDGRVDTALERIYRAIGNVQA